MSDLARHVVTDLCLTAAIVPDSNNASSSLKDLNNVRVAVADAMVHIAPEPAAGASGTEVTVVPTSAAG
ncbi:hypothetical protein [Kitasatospora sp. CB02891]|uniref:hypothetical protein n=1 Tax=Kitasatospora sp. CB02891 TaxID=2020329 RepID=UPI000C26E7F1|nr:hypothetical protein [Kitasatospora sp. CB02891]PJN21082.1 hypothetical protein CG736_35090 [Kitasatospora sp. CB02891]